MGPSTEHYASWIVCRSLDRLSSSGADRCSTYSRRKEGDDRQQPEQKIILPKSVRRRDREP